MNAKYFSEISLYFTFYLIFTLVSSTSVSTIIIFAAYVDSKLPKLLSWLLLYTRKLYKFLHSYYFVVTFLIILLKMRINFVSKLFQASLSKILKLNTQFPLENIGT